MKTTKMHKLKQIKLKSDLGAFFAIRQERGRAYSLFYCSWGSAQGAESWDTLIERHVSYDRAAL